MVAQELQSVSKQVHGPLLGLAEGLPSEMDLLGSGQMGGLTSMMQFLCPHGLVLKVG